MAQTYKQILTLTMSALFLLSPALAESPIGAGIDCSEVTLEFQDDPSLTRQQRIEMMDRALMESLERFEVCDGLKRAANQGGGATGGSSGNGASAGEDGSQGDGLESGDETFDSVGATGVSGENESPENADELGLPTQAASSSEGHKSEQTEGSWSDPRTPKTQESPSGTGRIPEDIPDAANDDVLAQQIRTAAENEPDPEKRRKLWDEYRKYKGLPSVSSQGTSE